MGKSYRRVFAWVGLVTIVAGSVVVLLIARYQELLLFPYYYVSLGKSADKRAEVLPPEFQRVLVGEPGQQIECWVAKPSAEPRGMALVFRANMGTLEEHRSLIEWPRDHGLVGIVFNYPGMGLSNGEPSEDSILRAGEEVFAHFKAKYLPSGGKSWVLGYSIGTGPAALFAAKHSPDLLILFAPYTDLKDVVSRHPIYRFFASLLHVRFPLREAIAALARTDFIVATGGRDTTILPDMSDRVFQFYHGTGRSFRVHSATGTHDHLLGANRPALDDIVGTLLP